MQVNANYIRYNPDMSIKETEVYSIDVETGDRVMFIDNSFLDKCYINTIGERVNLYPSGICGTVARTNSVQDVYDDWLVLGPRRIDMPIVVLGDDSSVIYCNAIHIRKLTDS